MNKNHPIPLFSTQFSGNEWKYLKDCLDTGWVSSAGSYVQQLEKKIADYVGADYSIATVSGTAALHIAMIVSGVKPDQEVLTTSLSFIASTNAIRYIGAWPVFIGIDHKNWQLDPQKLKDFIEHECQWDQGDLKNKQTGRKIKAILPVHILGHPVDMDRIMAIARKYNLVVIEDACQSLGAKYKQKKVGHQSDMACFSFNGNKIITTGGGGILLTNNPKWAELAKHLTTQAKSHAVEYIHDQVGFNYRLTNIQAALGCAQLENIDLFIKKKRLIADYYNRLFADIESIDTMQESSWAESTFWMYPIIINEEIAGLNSRQLMKNLAKENIQTRPLWCPIHQQAMYKNCQTYKIDYIDSLYDNTLCLPTYPQMSEQDQIRVTCTIKSLVC